MHSDNYSRKNIATNKTSKINKTYYKNPIINIIIGKRGENMKLLIVGITILLI